MNPIQTIKQAIASALILVDGTGQYSYDWTGACVKMGRYGKQPGDCPAFAISTWGKVSAVESWLHAPDGQHRILIQCWPGLDGGENNPEIRDTVLDNASASLDAMLFNLFLPNGALNDGAYTFQGIETEFYPEICHFTAILSVSYVGDNNTNW